VIGYLRAVNAHDAAGARALLAAEYQRELAGEIPHFEAWVANIVSVRLRILKPPGDAGTGLEGKYPLYRDIVEFGTTYDIVLHTQSALETAGSQTRFFVVGRSRTQGTWLILGIGTGP
jgi:hypothetical protein